MLSKSSLYIACLLLSGCASTIETTFMRPDGVTPERVTKTRVGFGNTIKQEGTEIAPCKDVVDASERLGNQAISVAPEAVGVAVNAMASQARSGPN